MPALDQIFSSKTVLFAIALSVLGVLQGFVFLLPLQPIEQMWVAIVISVIVTVLRWVTTQPLNLK